MWRFQNFSVSYFTWKQFWGFLKCKICHFLTFTGYENRHFMKAEINQLKKIQSSWNAKMAVLVLPNSLKLISFSRKIWVTEKLWTFHTVVQMILSLNFKNVAFTKVLPKMCESSFLNFPTVVCFWCFYVKSFYFFRRLPILEETASEIQKSTGNKVLPLQCDVRDPEAIR